MNVSVLTIPYDSGRSDWRMAKGPDYLLRSGMGPLLDRKGIAFQHEEIRLADPSLPEIASAFELVRIVSTRVRAARSRGFIPIVLSGNCLLAVGAVSGCGADTTGVVWFDGHGEANTPETTRSGFLDGMGIAILTGQCWSALGSSIPGFSPVSGNRIALVGARDVEPAEQELLARMRVQRAGSSAELAQWIETVMPEIDGIYLHFDLDVLDTAEAVANQWTPPGGLRLAALVEMVATLCDRVRLKGFGFGSCDPALDHDGRALRAATQITESILCRSCSPHP